MPSSSSSESSPSKPINRCLELGGAGAGGKAPAAPPSPLVLGGGGAGTPSMAQLSGSATKVRTVGSRAPSSFSIRRRMTMFYPCVHGLSDHVS